MNQYMYNTSQSRVISMTYWYPILAELQYWLNHPVNPIVYDKETKSFKKLPRKDPGFKLRVPDTIFVHYPYGGELGQMADGKRPRGLDYLIKAIDNAAKELGGYPIFLRTEQSSDKHSWKDSCYVTDPAKLDMHIYRLIEHSMMADWPYDMFAVRKLIPTTPITTTFHGQMPVAKERRLFIEDNKVVCNHPYWPNEAFETDGVPHQNVTQEQITELQNLTDEEKEQVELAATHAAKHFPSAWSIDFLQDSNGDWWCIDMALAQSSYHWPGCPNNKKADK